MSRARTFSLNESDDGILADLVRSGRFGTETEAVQAGIRMLAEHQARLEALQQAIKLADSEIAAGQGREYGSAAELLADVTQDGGDDR